MKKSDIYKIRSLFERIDNDFKNDHPRGTTEGRAELISRSVNDGINICNDYLHKMKPMAERGQE